MIRVGDYVGADCGHGYFYVGKITKIEGCKYWAYWSRADKAPKVKTIHDFENIIKDTRECFCSPDSATLTKLELKE